MKRITPEDVVDAYIATGMYPTFHKWSTRDGSGGCAVTAINVACGHQRLKGYHAWNYAERLGFDRHYLWGFVLGFDERPFNYDTCYYNQEDLMDSAAIESADAAYIYGQLDGAAARAAVTAHFAKATSEQPQEVATCGTP